MLVVAGLSLANLKPRVWDPRSPHYIPALDGVMVSYAEFDRYPTKRRQAMERGLRDFLGVPASMRVFLDNGSFSFARRGRDVPVDEYEQFVTAAKPDWYPVPQDFIPSPAMSEVEMRDCLDRTMAMNAAFADRCCVPVIHICPLIGDYLDALQASARLTAKPRIALGGIVPNLLRAPRARPYGEVLGGVRRARRALAGREMHLFGVGGTATLHLAALLGIDSVDSSGWRNRAARGIVQLPGRGDRMVAELGSWRGRRPDSDEWSLLAGCRCPACRSGGLEALRAGRLRGFEHRATHNLWTLLEEARLIERHLREGTYPSWYTNHVQNSNYVPLIEHVLEANEGADAI